MATKTSPHPVLEDSLRDPESVPTSTAGSQDRCGPHRLLGPSLPLGMEVVYFLFIIPHSPDSHPER